MTEQEKKISVEPELQVKVIGDFIASSKYQNEIFINKLLVVASSLKRDISLASTEQFQLFVEQEFSKLEQIEQNKAFVQITTKKVHRLYVDGCFDLMHSGHFNAIRQAKQLCEVLVVGVVSEEEVILRKGPPVLSNNERLALARACKWVDEVVENVPYDPTLQLLDSLNCTHIAHGDDQVYDINGEDCYGMFKKAGRYLEFKRTEGISTTDIVGRLLLMTKSVPDQEAKMIRKKSGDSGILATKLDKDDKEQKEIQQNNPNSIKLLNTTRRIRQFSQENREQQASDKVVYIDGSFDILHIGHINVVKKAKELGTYLIVGLHDDSTINQQKGENFPILNIQERVLNVLAMKDVDEVIIGAPWKITEHMIKQFKIDYVVEGSLTKYRENVKVFQNPSEDPFEIPKRHGIFQIISSDSDMTTDKIIQRIIDNRLRYLEIYNKKQKKQELYYTQQKGEVTEI